MKIYINTDNTPATIASTYKISEGTSPIKPYTFGATATSFEFKRGNDVEIEVAFAGTQAPSVAELAKLTMGLKVSGQYDTLLALKAETQTFVADDDGLAVGTLNFNVSGLIIDEALKVNTGAEDDAASAAFSLEFQWTGVDGNVHATKTLSATITNNVIRDGDAPAGPGYNVGVVMLVECTQAEYDAIEDKPEHVYYLITDAEDNYVPETIDPATTEKLGTVKLSTGNSVQNGSLVGFNANGQLSVPVAGVNVAGTVRLCTSHAQEVNQCGWTGVSSKGELLVMKPALTGTARRFGAVRIADSLNDTDAYACPTAAQVRAGLQGVTPIDTTGFVDLTSDQQIAGAKTIFGSWLRFAADETDIETGAVKILGTRGGIYFQVEDKPNFAMINLDNLTKIEEIAFKSDIPNHPTTLISWLRLLTYSVKQQEDGTWAVVQNPTTDNWTDFDQFGRERAPTAYIVAKAISDLNKKIAELEATIKNLHS